MENNNKFEMMCGLTLAIMATILSVIDLGAGKYGDDEIIAINEKSAAYQWYQSKSIKETSVEAQHDLVKTLVDGGVVKNAEVEDMKTFETKLEKKLDKYRKEKNEILKGSSKIPEAEWVQEKNGKKGEIIGAEEWTEKADKLGSAGDIFDLSGLFLQICLVLGAVALVMKNRKLKWAFFLMMLLLGTIGLIYGWNAYQVAKVV
ncbi:MAG: DUF4337 domain-containing protein [Bacteroidota bacterium]|nr:DUF4337 domain-containing protein [Bacteroidota bacterium]